MFEKGKSPKLLKVWEKHKRQVKKLRDRGTSWYKIEEFLHLKEGKKVLSGSTIRRYFNDEYVRKYTDTDVVSDPGTVSGSGKTTGNTDFIKKMGEIFDTTSPEEQDWETLCDSIPNKEECPPAQDETVKEYLGYSHQKKRLLELSQVLSWAKSSEELPTETRIRLVEAYLHMWRM